MKINEMMPGSDNVEFEAIIAKVTVGKTNGNNKSNYLNLVLEDQTGSLMQNFGQQHLRMQKHSFKVHWSKEKAILLSIMAIAR